MINQNPEELVADASSVVLDAENTVQQQIPRNQKSSSKSFKFLSKRNLLEGIPKKEENTLKNDDQININNLSGCQIKNTNTRMPFDFFRNLKKHLQFKSLTICKPKQKVKEMEGPYLPNHAHQATGAPQNDNPMSPVVSCLSNEIHESQSTDSSCKNEAINMCEASSSSGNTLEVSETPQEDVHKKRGEEENTETIDVSKDDTERAHLANSSHNELQEEQSQVARPVNSNTIEYDTDSIGPNVDVLPHISDAVTSDSKVKASLTKELLKLSKHGWYWGPISGDEADAKLISEPDGAFLVRDSSDDRYVLTLSFKSSGKLLHARMEHSGGLFSLCNQSETEGFTSVTALINHSMNFSQSAVFCYSRPKYPGYPSFPVRLTKPVSRFTQVRSLQYLCRFVIRQNTRLDNIHKLPLPKTIKGYIEEAHY